MKLVIYMLATMLLVYALLNILLYVFQRDLLYYPSVAGNGTIPVELFANQGEKIAVLVLNPNQPRAIIYFAGNAESVAASAPVLAHALSDFTLYAVNYRGYAGSSGTPTEKALYSDALYLHDVLIERHDSVSVIGRSLGSAVATYLGAQRELDKLVLITPFDSILNVARERFSLFAVSLLLKDTYDSAARAGQISASTLAVLAQRDEIISAQRSQRLIDAFAPGQVNVVTIQGSAHNDLSSKSRYYEALRHFFSTDK